MTISEINKILEQNKKAENILLPINIYNEILLELKQYKQQAEAIKFPRIIKVKKSMINHVNKSFIQTCKYIYVVEYINKLNTISKREFDELFKAQRYCNKKKAY